MHLAKATAEASDPPLPNVESLKSFETP